MTEEAPVQGPGRALRSRGLKGCRSQTTKRPLGGGGARSAERESQAGRPRTVAAVNRRAVQGEAGSSSHRRTSCAGFLQRLRRAGIVLLIADEVEDRFGRTGPHVRDRALRDRAPTLSPWRTYDEGGSPDLGSGSARQRSMGYARALARVVGTFVGNPGARRPRSPVLDVFEEEGRSECRPDARRCAHGWRAGARAGADRDVGGSGRCCARRSSSDPAAQGADPGERHRSRRGGRGEWLLLLRRGNHSNCTPGLCRSLQTASSRRRRCLRKRHLEAVSRVTRTRHAVCTLYGVSTLTAKAREEKCSESGSPNATRSLASWGPGWLSRSTRRTTHCWGPETSR